MRVKMGSFRASLMEQLLSRFVHFLEEVAPKLGDPGTPGIPGDISGEHFREIKVRLDSTSSCSSSSASPPGETMRLDGLAFKIPSRERKQWYSVWRTVFANVINGSSPTSLASFDFPAHEGIDQLTYLKHDIFLFRLSLRSE